MCATRVVVWQPRANVTNFTQIGVILRWKWSHFSSLGVTASGLSAHLIKCTLNLICVFSMHSARWRFYCESHFQNFFWNCFRLCYIIRSNVICNLGISVMTHVAAGLKTTWEKSFSLLDAQFEDKKVHCWAATASKCGISTSFTYVISWEIRHLY